MHLERPNERRDRCPEAMGIGENAWRASLSILFRLGWVFFFLAHSLMVLQIQPCHPQTLGEDEICVEHCRGKRAGCVAMTKAGSALLADRKPRGVPS